VVREPAFTTPRVRSFDLPGRNSEKEAIVLLELLRVVEDWDGSILRRRIHLLEDLLRKS
jgi:hypothetical protein